ncbi:P-loop NTPase fold protein [uncultured Pseudoflavonifractor sp.]|uniref:KAP family P-loop NTPase fold protein n=1 Tax=uncultured Pseudoflavonifractor sp. TaxID=1221379 RepID=UPI0025F774B9|nr:P-loop NTPase fold protein [uncultured Pseudoflavonifractor sp.]
MAGFTDKPLSGRSEDIFDVEKYIKGLSSFILECDTPMTVAVQGDWGSGKTSFMMLIREELEAKVLPVWFNTWQFSQFNLGDRLPLLLVSRLTAALGLKGIQADSIKSSLRTLGGVLFRVGLSAANTVTGLDVSGAAEAAMHSGEEDVTEAVSTLKSRFQDCVKQALKEKKKDRVVIFVDDLDRLAPARAVELLEVLKLFLDCDKCVFLLAIDYAVVSQGIRQKYGESLGTDKGRSFFDKIIQVPFKMPVAHYDIEKFVRTALEQMRLPVADAAPYVSLIRTSIGYNPRGIKRLLNAFLLLQRIHSGEHLDQDHEKRLLFAVLCLQLSYEEVYNFVVRSISRLTPAFFNQLAQPERYAALLSGDELDEDMEENDPLLQELFEQWGLDGSADVNRIADFMESFRTALSASGGALTREDLKLLENILNFSATTNAEAETAPSRFLSANGLSGRGIRYKNRLDDAAAYHSVSEPIVFDAAKKLPGWNNSKLEAFRLFGQEVPVRKYSAMLTQVLDLLYQRDPEKFRAVQADPAAHELSALFDCKRDSSKTARVPTAGVDVEVNSSSHDKVISLQRMMTAMGYNPGNLELKVRLAHRVEQENAG